MCTNRSDVCEGLITKKAFFLLFLLAEMLFGLTPHPPATPHSQDIQPRLHRSQAGNNKRRGLGEEGRHRKGPLACSQGTRSTVTRQALLFGDMTEE